ncbi:MAG: hypothetical protein LBM98_12845 [Oscillospiraceae bacterium]|nr:hypothetical protein [Oscillospiraceae bacterium]
MIGNCNVCNAAPPASAEAPPSKEGGFRGWDGGCVRARRGAKRGRRQGLPCPARHCEAPVSLRYVGRYRCEAIQCRGDNIRLAYRRPLRQPWIASPHIIATYRKCGGGFAKTGRASPCPVPAQCAGTVDGGCVRARRGKGGFETRPYVAPSNPP